MAKTSAGSVTKMSATRLSSPSTARLPSPAASPNAVPITTCRIVAPNATASEVRAP